VHNPALLPLLAERVIGLKQGRIAFDLPLAIEVAKPST
jgi:phosphonate transport system ATP-binding protein